MHRDVVYGGQRIDHVVCVVCSACQGSRTVRAIPLVNALGYRLRLQRRRAPCKLRIVLDPIRAPFIVNKPVCFVVLHILLIAAHRLRLNVEERCNVIIGAAAPDPTALLLGLLCAIIDRATPLTDTLSKGFSASSCGYAHLIGVTCAELKACWYNRSSGCRRGRHPDDWSARPAPGLIPLAPAEKRTRICWPKGPMFLETAQGNSDILF